VNNICLLLVRGQTGRYNIFTFVCLSLNVSSFLIQSPHPFIHLSPQPALAIDIHPPMHPSTQQPCSPNFFDFGPFSFSILLLPPSPFSSFSPATIMDSSPRVIFVIDSSLRSSAGGHRQLPSIINTILRGLQLTSTSTISSSSSSSSTKANIKYG